MRSVHGTEQSWESQNDWEGVWVAILDNIYCEAEPIRKRELEFPFSILELESLETAPVNSVSLLCLHITDGWHCEGEHVLR